mgnify:CR=1 FL=1
MQPANGGDLCVAVSLDGRELGEFSINEQPFYRKSGEKNILQNQSVYNITFETHSKQRCMLNDKGS